MRRISTSAALLLVLLACSDTAPRFGGAAATIFVDPESATIVAGDTMRFFAAVRDASGFPTAAPVQWRSENTAVVTIDSTGLATAALSGIVLNSSITATSGSAAKSAAITVEPCGTACGAWVSHAGMAAPRRELAVAGDANVLYAAGGTSNPSASADGGPQVDQLTVATGAWTSVTPMPDGRRAAAAVVVGGQLYVLGGSMLVPAPSTTTVRRFNPASNTWVDRAPMPTARIGIVNGDAPSGTIAVASGGIIYVLGGASAAVDAYDPQTNTWATRTPMPTFGRFTAAADVNGVLYAITRDVVSTAQTNVQSYDPATNVWSLKNRFTGTGNPVFAATVSGVLYLVTTNPILGGGSREAIYAYHPATDRWTPKSPAPDPGLGTSLPAGTSVSVGGAASSSALHIVYSRVGASPASVVLSFTP
jgi:hypothetical protein